MTKYIFDFDDVLFFNTEKFKKNMYRFFEEVGVPYDTVKKYYKVEREKGFVLGNLVSSVVQGEKISSISASELTEKIMGECKNFTNEELISKIKDLGPENCYMVTHGVTEYQLEKINRTGVKPLFCKISIVQDTKKESVEAVCEEFKDHEVIFVDDKEERFADLDFRKYPNLRTVLYVGSNSVSEIFRN
jgi:FMN phosphatase YigB (HAD superfamily)